MNNEIKKQTRRKFLGWGLASAAVFSAFKFFKPSEKKQKETVKMLTEDGTLVEVDIASLPTSKKKVTNTELQNWIKK